MRIVKTFENFDAELDTELAQEIQEVPEVSEEPQGETREYGFYWIVVQGNMTIGEWVNDPDSTDFWIKHGEPDTVPNDEVEEILQFIDPPVSDEYDEEVIEAPEASEQDTPYTMAAEQPGIDGEV